MTAHWPAFLWLFGTRYVLPAVVAFIIWWWI